jgi:hypothetical protein
MRGRASITWLIGGAVLVLLVLAGVDALRSGRSETSPSASLAEILSPAAPSSTQTTSADTSAAEAPVADAEIETRSLRRLKSLPAPQAERKSIGEFFRAAEGERDLLRKVAGQAAMDYPELLRILAKKREDATHLKDEVVARMAARWHLDPKPIQACPLLLPG